MSKEGESIRFKCDQCGRCCKVWNINLNIKDIRKIQKLRYKLKDFVEINGGLARFKMQRNKNCVFLDKDNLCVIQKKFGYASKPDVCKSFPYNEFVCGVPELVKRRKLKKKKEKGKAKKGYDEFFQISKSKKAIYTKVFFDMFGKLDARKPLFDSYCNLLCNVLSNKRNIILDEFKLRQYNIKLNKELIRSIEGSMFDKSKSSFLWFRKVLKKNIRVKLPVRDFKFSFEKAEIPVGVRKKFIQYVKKHLVLNGSLSYLIKLLIFFYFLPYFVKSVAGRKKVELIHVAHTFSLLNSMSRFGGFEQYRIIYINKFLDRFMKRR
jgi:Fe-S-cluster containining protein